MHENLSPNGILIFIGVNVRGNLINKIIEPPNLVSIFTYHCGATFQLSDFDHLFEDRENGCVMFLGGSLCLIYKFSHGKFEKVKEYDPNLINRQGRGGSSSNRISRITENSRTEFVDRVIDWINDNIKSSNNYVFGGLELIGMFLESKKLKSSFKQGKSHHVFDKKTINSSYFIDLMKKEIDISKYCKEILELLETDSEKLLFSIDEIIEFEPIVEYCIFICQNNLDRNNIPTKRSIPIFDVSISCPFYEKFKGYKVIAKKYY
jgi:hypothetical protein